jgi:hypothetical protein
MSMIGLTTPLWTSGMFQMVTGNPVSVSDTSNRRILPRLVFVIHHVQCLDVDMSLTSEILSSDLLSPQVHRGRGLRFSTTNSDLCVQPRTSNSRHLAAGFSQDFPLPPSRIFHYHRSKKKNQNRRERRRRGRKRQDNTHKMQDAC